MTRANYGLQFAALAIETGELVIAIEIFMQTKPVDLATYLQTDEDRAALLADALADTNHPELFTHALTIVARSRGISDLAAQTGITRNGIYKAISPDGNPSFATLRKLLDVVGVEITVRPKSRA